MEERHVRPRISSYDHSLPSSWWELINESTGIRYYWNDVTNVTQYERPSCLPPIQPLTTCPTCGSNIQRGVVLGQVREQVETRVHQGFQANSSFQTNELVLGMMMMHGQQPHASTVNLNMGSEENLPSKYCFDATNSGHDMPPQPHNLAAIPTANNQQDMRVVAAPFDNATPPTGAPVFPNSTLMELSGATNILPTKHVQLASLTSNVPLIGRSKDSLYISFLPDDDDLGAKWYHLNLAEGEEIVNENGSKEELITSLLDEGSRDGHFYSAFTVLNSLIYKVVHKDTGFSANSEVQILETESREGLSWKEFTPLAKDRTQPWVVSMGGKIYVVAAENKGCNIKTQYEVNDIEVLRSSESSKWESLPVRSLPITNWFRYFVVAVEDLNKLVIGSGCEKCLFLYDVCTRHQERLDFNDVMGWGPELPPAVAGNRLFMFSISGISAYDLVERCFWHGTIDGLDHSFLRANCNDYEDPRLIYLGGGKLCLICFRSHDTSTTIVHCCVFGVPEFREECGHRSLLGCVHYVHKFSIDYTEKLLDVLLL